VGDFLVGVAASFTDAFSEALETPLESPAGQQIRA
jgi:hypothetical protein